MLLLITKQKKYIDKIYNLGAYTVQHIIASKLAHIS